MPNARKVMMPALLMALSAGAQQGGDMQAQILYAYQTEDTNHLSELIQDLNTRLKSQPADPSPRYHLAHAHYRLGQIGDAHGRDGESAYSDCVDDLKPVLRQDVKSVEALALQSACYSSLARSRTLEAVLLRSRAADRLQTAFKLAPRNPRVVYLLAMEQLAGSKPGSPERARAIERLALAARLFDDSSATRVDAPGWGHAEAYLALGMELQARGDRVGARNWIEKSLIAAPDYKLAQRQLSVLTGR